MVFVLDDFYKIQQNAAKLKDNNILFKIVLWPHNSLDASFAFVVFFLMLLVAFAGGVRFWLIGAVPVAFIFFFEWFLLALVFFVFWYRRRNYCEVIRATDKEVYLERIRFHRIINSYCFGIYGLRIEGGGVDDGELRFCRGRRSVVFGQFLSRQEKQDFFKKMLLVLEKINFSANTRIQ